MDFSLEQTPISDRYTITPWDDDPLAASVRVVVEKIDPKTSQPCHRVHIYINSWKTDIENARTWANAILKAIEIAEHQS